MEIKYPPWAPNDLCEHHKMVLGHINNKNSKIKRTKGFEILESVILNKDMKKVWLIIKRYSESGFLKNMCDIEMPVIMGKTVRTTVNSYGFRLLHNVKSAYAYSVIKYKTKNEKKEFYKAVSKQASELSSLIKKTDFDLTPRRYHPDFDKYSDDGFILADDAQVGFEMSNVLQRLSNDAEMNEAMVDDETQVLPYPNIRNAQRTAFIRVLSLHFMNDYNSYLYRTQATLARIVLDDSIISENMVKDALKGWAGDLNTIPEWNFIG